MVDKEESAIVKLMIEQGKVQKEMQQALITHIESEESAIKKFMEAFPSGDLEGHKRYHEALIKAAEAKSKIWQAVITKSLEGLVWACLVWIGYSVWNAITGRTPQ